jgi:phage head maturation protease
MRLRWLAATATPVMRWDYELGPYWEVLACTADAVDLSRLSAGVMPLLDTHDSWGGIHKQIGQITTAWFTDAGLELEADVFEEALPHGRAARIAAGQAAAVSVGYVTLAAEVTGRAADGLPIVTITGWQLHELSNVPVPADPAVRLLEVSDTDPAGSPVALPRAAPQGHSSTLQAQHIT